MSKINVQLTDKNGTPYQEDIVSFCKRISKRNNSILFQLEEYLNKKLLADEELMKIRDTILTVSAEVNKIPDCIVVQGDNDEGL